MPTELIMFFSVIVALYACIHAMLVYNARQVVSAAAQDAVAAAQAEDATAADGETAGRATLALGTNLIGATVDVDRNDERVEATASASINNSLLDILTDIEVTTSGPVERFFAEDERE